MSATAPDKKSIVDPARCNCHVSRVNCGISEKIAIDTGNDLINSD